MKALAIVVLMCSTALGAHPRSAPPKKWDKATMDVFFDNAFETLEGSRPERKVVEKQKVEEKIEEVHGDFDRSELMKKLERSEEIIQEILSSDKNFKAGLSKIDQPVDMVIMLGKTIFHSDPDYNQDDDFLKFSEELLSSAKSLKAFCKKSDYEGASSAFSRMKKSCNSCHQVFK
jgi:cytochrome c556